MTDTPAAILPRRPLSPERGGFTVEQARANCFAFEVKASIISYIISMLVLSFLHGVDPRPLFYVTLKYTFLTVALVFGVMGRQHFYGMLFIYFKRSPYDIGDWIEFDPSESSVSLDVRRTWRVERVTLFFTDFVNLYNEMPATWLNKRLANRPLINWSWLPAKFQIIFQVPVDSCGDLLLFEKFHEQVKQFADDNPSEWIAVGSFMVNKITVGKDHTEYCAEIRHRQSWHELGLVMRSKAELIRYCHLLLGELNNQKPAKRHGSAFPTAFGCNNEDGGDNTDDNKEHESESDQNNANDGVNNIDNTLGVGEQEEVDGEEDENDNDDGTNYRIFVR